jgi:hypothetical protein
LIHGNELLGGKLTTPNANENVRNYSQRSHTASAVLALLKNFPNLFPPFQSAPIQNLTVTVDIFIGYLLFDTWIANQDRHDQNWGLVRVKNDFYLAPSYDHGSSLARNLTDSGRIGRMATKDIGFSIEKYVATARSSLYPNPIGSEKVKSFLTIDLLRYAIRLFPTAGIFWAHRLNKISEKNVEEALEQIPISHMSNASKDFTKKLLILNQKRIIALILNS